MRGKLFWAILIILGIVVVGISSSPRQILDWASKQPIASGLVDRIFQNQYLPGPLRGSFAPSSAQLTRDGVVLYTNDQRSAQGLLPLKVNQRLNQAAEAKLNDMFAQQYFEHESPDGKSPADVIKAAGYEYIVVGENLALGNFPNDQELVNAWMNSPGHRANILHTSFQEIGVAVGKGTFEGKSVWLAVQEFGRPYASCPAPTDGLKSQINNNRAQIETWQNQLNEMKAKLERNNYPSHAEYEKDLKAYNDLVEKTNSLVNQTKILVEQYNQQVNAFNSCLEKNG